ncbi:MAG TPA: sulfite exporter TauE/SafE family protein [Candidatus Thermoplasmatota archaeon]|nr:sulfite exporter TauE/SafE family protein [Candidatus Thermoplasmatota archaeon]
MDVAFAALTLALGLAAGFLSGLFGVGGGVVMVPAILLLVPDTGFHAAKAVSLLVISLATLVGVLRHRRAGNVDFRVGALLATTGLAGSVVGTAASLLVAGRVLEAGFGLFIAATGAQLARPGETRPRALAPRARAALLAAVGFAGGLLAGFFGVGGGIVMVPGMVLAGFGMHLAVGTSLVAVFGNAVAATATNVGYGFGDVLARLGLPIALGSLAGITLGVAAANRLHATRLRRLFGAFLIVVGIGMLVRAALGH